MVFPAIDRPIQNETDIRTDYYWLLTVPDRTIQNETDIRTDYYWLLTVPDRPMQNELWVTYCARQTNGNEDGDSWLVAAQQLCDVVSL